MRERERKRKTNVQGVTMEGSKDLVQPILDEKMYMFTVKYTVGTLNIAKQKVEDMSRPKDGLHNCRELPLEEAA